MEILRHLGEGDHVVALLDDHPLARAMMKAELTSIGCRLEVDALYRD